MTAELPSPLRLGLIGYPLEHSYSPQLHGAALHALGLQGEYRLYPVPPAPQGAAGLVELLSELRGGNLHGLNVTIPHKQAVLPLLDEVTPAVRNIGAANTLMLWDGRLIGDNTDVPGFLADLEAVIKTAGRKPAAGCHALVLGAGGAARAVVYALLIGGWSVTVAARRLEQVQSLTADFMQLNLSFQGTLSAVCLDFSSLSGLEDVNLIVNATPLGMFPSVGTSPWIDAVPFPRGALVYDLVYNPTETVLVRAARRAGLPAVTGLGMLVEQAALAFERWTGMTAPRDEMRKAVNL